MVRIADLDLETRKVILFAHIVAERPTEDNLTKLRVAIEGYDEKHKAERTRNLIRALFDMAQQPCPWCGEADECTPMCRSKYPDGVKPE